jgi:hypothetical protein
MGRKYYMEINKPGSQGYLQDLYPGRPIESTWGYNGENIPSEDPQETRKVRDEDFALTQASKKMQMNFERHLGSFDDETKSIRPSELIVNPPDDQNTQTDDSSQASNQSANTPPAQQKTSSKDKTLPILMFIAFLMFILIIVLCIKK